MIKVFTYFEPVHKINEEHERKLLCLWIDNWRSKGFDPHVLNEHWARKSPLFTDLEEKVKQFPSTNPPGYDRNCYYRWAAVSVAGKNLDTVIMADYDCFSYAFHPIHMGSRKLTFYQGHVPCLVSGKATGFSDVVKMFIGPKTKRMAIEGTENHLSDMLFIQAKIKEEPLYFHPYPLVKDYGEEGWEKAVAVHYCNSTMTPAKLTPRHEHIQKLRGW